MNQDELQSLWNLGNERRKTEADLKKVMQLKQHRAVRRARKQLIIEIVAFSLFLLAYYDIFDGHLRPWYINLVLVLAILMFIGYHVMGYLLLRRSPADGNLKQALLSQATRVRQFGIVSIALRGVSMACILMFFLWIVPIDGRKLWLAAGIALLFAVQMVWLSRIWSSRVRQLRQSVEDLDQNS